MRAVAIVATVDFHRPQVVRPARPARVPSVCRLLALAHAVDDAIRRGEVADLADAARVFGLTRARITQMMNLTLLAPEIQEAILELPAIEQGRDEVSERGLRSIAAEPAWDRQVEMWKALTRRPSR
jgi:hypothetical protein